jgi:hypothetical protein
MLEIGNLRQMGVVHSPYREQKEAPFQGRHTRDVSTLEVFEDYEPGPLHIEQCSTSSCSTGSTRPTGVSFGPVRPGGPRCTAFLQRAPLTGPIR